MTGTNSPKWLYHPPMSWLMLTGHACCLTPEKYHSPVCLPIISIIYSDKGQTRLWASIILLKSILPVNTWCPSSQITYFTRILHAFPKWIIHKKSCYFFVKSIHFTNIWPIHHWWQLLPCATGLIPMFCHILMFKVHCFMDKQCLMTHFMVQSCLIVILWLNMVKEC